jgi:hypothetical protein
MLTMNPFTVTRSPGPPGRRAALVAIAACVSLALLASSACTGATQPVRIDLLSLLSHAEKRPLGVSGTAFSFRTVQIGGQSQPAVAVPQPSRVGWVLKIPRRATLTGYAGLEPDATGKYAGDATFRIGVSGGKLYEQVFERRLNPAANEADRAFVPLSIDLSAWAGWQWSLFYRPSESSWKIVFSVDGPATSNTPYWVAPMIAGVK